MFARILCLLSTAALIFANPTTEPDGSGTAPAPAPGAPADGVPAEAPDMTNMWIFFAILMFFMWFVIIRPQSKEQKKRKSMMAELKVGQKVVSIGGIHGKVIRKGESDIDVEVAKDVVMTFNLGAVQQVVDADEKISETTADQLADQ